MIEALEFLGRGPNAVLRDGHLFRLDYYRGHHPEFGKTKNDGWQGNETEREEPLPTNAPIQINEEAKLISRCVEHDLNLPKVEGYEYTDGYCRKCVKHLSKPVDEVVYQDAKKKALSEMLEIAGENLPK